MRIAFNNHQLVITRQGITWGHIARAAEGRRSVARDSWQSPYLSALRNQVPLKADYELYKILREAIPCLDTAIAKLVLLLGKLEIVADEPLKTEIEQWMTTVKVNHLQQGFSSWQANHLDSMLWSGKAVGEIVPNNAGNDIYQLRNLESETIVLTQIPDDPASLAVCQSQTGSAQPVELDPAWTVVNLFNPGTNPHGVSLFKSLPFVSEILMTMEHGLRQTWERFGSPTFHVDYEPPEGFVDPDGTKIAAIMKGIEDNFTEAMDARKSGQIRDFFSSNVKISMVGWAAHVLEFKTPYTAIMEQIAGKTGLPYWMLGFPWGSTERLSTQQADVLIATVEGIWDELYPDLRRIIDLRLAMTGKRGEYDIIRNATTLQDAVETARAEFIAAQGEAKREETAAKLWTKGVYTQEQYAEHVLGDKWDGEIANPMDEPPSPPSPTFGSQSDSNDDNNGNGNNDGDNDGDGNLGRSVRPFRSLTYSSALYAGKEPKCSCHKVEDDDGEIVSSTQAEEPSDERIADVIDKFYSKAANAARRLRNRVWEILDLPAVESEQNDAARDYFSYSAEDERLIDEAVEIFLAEMAGQERTRLGFVSAQTGDGLIQEYNVFAHSIGATRAAEMTNVTVAAGTGRDSSAVQAVLEHAFDRLSEQGRMRLEGVLDDIHAIIEDGVANSLNPLDVARELAGQFDAYEGWEFERLARTEVAFAQVEGQVNEWQAEGIDTSGVDGDLPPWHPNCLCDLTIEETDTGWVVKYNIAATACEVCQAHG